MKIKIALCLMAGVSAYAQNPPANPPTTTTDPTGRSCASNSVLNYIPSGVLYTCQSGIYAEITAAGAPPSGAAGGDLGGTYPNPTVTNGSHITNSSIPNSGLANPSVTVSGSTCALGSTCIPGFPNSSNKGSLVASTINTTTTNNTGYLIGNTSGNSQGCGGAPSSMPVAGTLRKPTAYVSTSVTTATVFFGPNPNCQFGQASTNSGPIAGAVYLPGAAAGPITDATSVNIDYWHQQAYYPLGMFASKLNNNGTDPNVVSIGAEFVDDAGLYTTILAEANNTVFTASSNNFTGFYGGATNATEANIGLPIPMAGTILQFVDCQGTAPTAGVTATLRKSGVSQTVTASTGTVANICAYDTTHTFSVAAGDWIDVLHATGATTQTAPGFVAVAFQPTTAGHFIVGGHIGGTVSTTKTFNSLLSTLTTTTEANVGFTLPVAYTCTNLYVMEAGANAGVTTTFTIRDSTSASDTAITGTVSSGAGGITKLVYSGAGVALTAGHVYNLSYQAGSGTSEAWGGWAMDCQ